MRGLKEVLKAVDPDRHPLRFRAQWRTSKHSIARCNSAILVVAEVQVAAVVAVHGASVPWGLLQADSVTIVPARRLPNLLQALPPRLGPERVAWLADRARLRFRAAA